MTDTVSISMVIGDERKGSVEVWKRRKGSVTLGLYSFYALAWPSGDGGFKPRTRPHSEGKFASHCTTIAPEKREGQEGGGVGIFERQQKG
ncbi:hypothetical protein PoB_005369800 [Plakobranchus ocellatus]|uniref:Uncharacterized protein n=1 Tax=Plakobranchus ocellatus TaxID=259542 RepID=A0AAV4C872_9GAST|nr:hypothetical protein PoB_005369800 [Plakobranchus ocellatus]